MSQRYEIDLESEKILFDGAWVTRQDLTEKITAKLASGDHRIGQLGGALEQLAKELEGARSISIKLTGAQFSKLEALGLALGKTAGEAARELFLQSLGGDDAPAITPLAPPPVIAAPAFVPPVATADVTPEEAAVALTMKPKSKAPAAEPPPVVEPPVADTLRSGKSGRR